MKRKNKKFQKRGSNSLSKLSLFQKTDGRFSKRCPLSVKNAPIVDYKNVSLLKKYMSENGKIISSKITSVSFNKQKKLTREIKKARGIGGIFFDYKKKDFEKDFNFVRDVGLTFKNIFREIISRKQNKKWDKKLKQIQNLKRGRYVEFNLLYDRGTKFGLQTGGNVEGILMSLPPIAKWK